MVFEGNEATGREVGLSLKKEDESMNRCMRSQRERYILKMSYNARQTERDSLPVLSALNCQLTLTLNTEKHKEMVKFPQH